MALALSVQPTTLARTSAGVPLAGEPLDIAPTMTPDQFPQAPPLSAPMPVAPTPAPSPYQNRGTGTTPFAVSSGGVKVPAIISIVPYGTPVNPGVSVPVFRPTLTPIGYLAPALPVYNPATPQPLQPVVPANPASKTIAPVRTGVQPVKAPTTPVPTLAVVPPITGTVAGFDLAQVPLWGWLVAAAVVGALVLRR